MRSTLLQAMSLSVALAGCAPVYMTQSSGTPDPSGDAPAVRRSSPAPPRERDRSSPALSLSAMLGALIWPLAIERADVLSSRYGFRSHPVAGAGRFHSGLDLRAPGGTPVHAAADGIVVRSETSGGYGHFLLIDHGSELQSLYGHNRENLVRQGDRVRRGQVIALVGRTGNATGDHLHFELRWRGGTVDPWVVLPRLGTRPAR